jgi:hypothetical protein
MENFINTVLIIEKYFKPSIGAYTCACMAMELAPYYEKLALLEVNNPSLVHETILHDYEGLRSDNDYFIPRLA